jgi:glycosyltransferase involved in cell wall biosynthesis
MKKKFVEILSHYPGGCTDQISEKENYVRYPVKIMRSKGYEAEILTLWKKGLKKEERVTGIKVKRFASAFTLLRYVFRSKEIVLVHSFLRPFPAALLSGILWNKPRVITPTTYELGSNKLIAAGSVFFMKMFNKVLALTPYEHSIYLRHNFKSKAVLLPFCIDYGFFSKTIGKKKVSLRKKYGAKEGEFIIISVANFRRFKNLDIMLSAFKEFQKNVTNSRFIIVGKDMLTSDLYKEQRKQKKITIKGMVNSLKIFEHVTVTGSLDSSRVRELYQISDLFVNSSDPEAQGIAVYEAAAAGMPLCLSKIGSFTTVFGDYALYNKPRDSEGLAKNFLEYYRNSKLRKRNGQRLRDLMKKWDYSEITKRLEAIYASLLKNE